MFALSMFSPRLCKINWTSSSTTSNICSGGYWGFHLISIPCTAVKRHLLLLISGRKKEKKERHAKDDLLSAQKYLDLAWFHAKRFAHLTRTGLIGLHYHGIVDQVMVQISVREIWCVVLGYSSLILVGALCSRRFGRTRRFLLAVPYQTHFIPVRGLSQCGSNYSDVKHLSEYRWWNKQNRAD